MTIIMSYSAENASFREVDVCPFTGLPPSEQVNSVLLCDTLMLKRIDVVSNPSNIAGSSMM